MGGLLSEKSLSIPFAGPSLTPHLFRSTKGKAHLVETRKYRVDAWGEWSLFQVLLQTLNKVVSKHGVSIPTVAVRYVFDQSSVAGSMIGVRLGLSEHINDSKTVLLLNLGEDDVNSIQEVIRNGKDLLRVIGDCGNAYRRA